MTCQTVTIGDAVVHINHGPEMVEVVRRSEGEKWCFPGREREWE